MTTLTEPDKRALEHYTGYTGWEALLATPDEAAGNEVVLGKKALELLAMPEFQPGMQPSASAIRRLGQIGMRLHSWEHAGKDTPEIALGLLPQQVAPFEKSIDFATSLDAAAAVLDEIPLERLITRKGYMELPTGYGKTVLMAYLARRLGIGTTLADGRRSRALLIVPSHDILDQAVGEADRRGFARFAPDISVSEISGRIRKKRAAEGDVVMMPYPTFARLSRSNPAFFDDFDTLLFDEAHELMGPQNKAALEAVGEGKLIIGFTATAGYNQDRQLKDILPEQIESIDLRESINNGFLRAARLQPFYSGVTVDLKIRGKDYSEESLSTLRHNEERNRLITELATNYVEAGRSGIISCIPGDNCAHAYELARQLSAVEITLGNGQKRQITARVVSEADRQSAEYIRQFDEGEIDVLLYVDKLRQGWDSDRVGFVLSARPTASMLWAAQRFGRGTRPSPYYEDTIYAEIIDSTTRLRPYTIFDVMGEDMFLYDKYIGPAKPKGSERTPPKRKPVPQEDTVPQPRSKRDAATKVREPKTRYLPPSMRGASAQLDGTLIDEVFIGRATPEATETMPSNWQPLAGFRSELNMTTAELLARLTRACNRPGSQIEPPMYLLEPHAKALIVGPQAAAYLAELERVEDAGVDDVALGKACLLVGRPANELRALLEKVDAPPYYRRSRESGKIGLYTSVKTLIRQAEHTPTSHMPTIKAVAEAVGVEPTRIAYFLNQAALSSIIPGIGHSVTEGRRGYYHLVPPASQQAALERFSGKLPDGAIDTAIVMQALGMSSGDFRSLLREKGLEEGKLRRTIGPSGHYEYVMPDDWPEVAAILSAHYWGPGVWRRAIDTLQASGHGDLLHEEKTAYGGKAAGARTGATDIPSEEKSTQERPEAPTEPMIGPITRRLEDRIMVQYLRLKKYQRHAHIADGMLTLRQIERLILVNPKIIKKPSDVALAGYMSDYLLSNSFVASVHVVTDTNGTPPTVYYSQQCASVILRAARESSERAS